MLREYVKKHKLSRLVKVPQNPLTEEAEINKAELEFEQQADGWFVVSTDTKAEDGFTTEEIIAQYKHLQMVENGFNTLKSTLDIRPMFHWTPQQIRAHVFICFMALQLTVFFNLRLKKTKISFEKAFSKLRRISVVTWQSGHSHHQALVAPNDEQLEIFKALKTPKPSMRSLVVSDF